MIERPPHLEGEELALGGAPADPDSPAVRAVRDRDRLEVVVMYYVALASDAGRADEGQETVDQGALLLDLDDRVAAVADLLFGP